MRLKELAVSLAITGGLFAASPVAAAAPTHGLTAQEFNDSASHDDFSDVEEDNAWEPSFYLELLKRLKINGCLRKADIQELSEIDPKKMADFLDIVNNSFVGRFDALADITDKERITPQICRSV